MGRNLFPSTSRAKNMVLGTVKEPSKVALVKDVYLSDKSARKLGPMSRILQSPYTHQGARNENRVPKTGKRSVVIIDAIGDCRLHKKAVNNT